MDPRERIKDFQEVLLSVSDSVSSGLYVAWPGTIVSVDLTKLTASVQPTIMGQFRDKAGVIQNWRLPVLLDCPIHFPSGGGFTLTFPLAPGDEVLVIIADRCIDAWHALGPGSTGAQAPLEMRFHDLSDGFVIPKVWSVPNVVGGVSATTTQLRSDDGTTYVEVAGGGVTNIVAPGGLKITAPTVEITGYLTVDNEAGHSSASTFSGTIRTTGGDVIADAVSLQTHVHSGVQPGGGDTGPPV